MLGGAGFAGAEVDAAFEGDFGALGAEAPDAAGGEAEGDALALGGDGGDDGGVEVEADGVGLGFAALDGVFAADVLAGFGDVEAAVVDPAVDGLVAVVAGFEPVGAVGFLALGVDDGGDAA